MAKKKSGASGGVVKSAFTVVWLIIVAGGIVGLARANDLTSPAAIWDYAKSWSDKANECVGEAERLECEVGSPGSDPGGSGGVPINPDEEISAPEVTALITKLDSLPKGSSQEVEYDRSEWAHWTDPDDNGCDAREDVLLRQGTKLELEPGDACDVVSGLWVSPYEGLEITDPSSIDIDHVIPLGWAAKHGGQAWPADKKEAFANDFSHLLATSASTNRSKSDRGPSEWMPERKEYWCSYGRLWVSTASKYQLTMPDADRKVLREALQSC